MLRFEIATAAVLVVLNLLVWKREGVMLALMLASIGMASVCGLAMITGLWPAVNGQISRPAVLALVFCTLAGLLMAGIAARLLHWRRMRRPAPAGN